MKKILITSLLGLFFLYGHAQSGYHMKENEKYIDVNFLTSYYNQDGNNSAVEGGLGTQQLTDAANMLIINIPIDSARSISASVGADFYTSASTDMIDSRMSSASSKDLRAYASLGYHIKKLNSGWTYGGKLGFSAEFDYTSVNGGLSLTKEWNEGNSEISLNGQAFIDQWKLYFPKELRGRVSVPTSNRRSYNVAAIFSQILNQRMQFSLSAEAIYMEGLLSTPFHRVYFSDNSQHDIERLPASRLKLPFSIRFNYFPVDQLILRTYYRYYTDDFGINAHTFSIEVPLKVSDNFSIAPFFRYHTQSAADYFAPFSGHLSTEEFYTSDYDLAALKSQKFGIALSYSPDFGLARGNLMGRPIMFKSIDFRTAYYSRDTGLNSFLFSANFNFNF